ncbi:uncharacterized protein TNCV_846701 [Trichonephila clavipes]|nr:uncharacterized protein TNCV_846701 [Trichonephila clavipes]
MIWSVISGKGTGRLDVVKGMMRQDQNQVVSVEESQISFVALKALALNSREQLIKEQREDPELGHIYHYLENPDDGSVNATVCKAETHDNWDRFLHEFSFALRTAVNEPTGKTPAELFLGGKIVTPFHKLINVTGGAEYVGGNIEKLFDETRQNMRNNIRHGKNTIIEKGERVLEVRDNNLTIWKKGRKVTDNIDQVLVYHPRHYDTNSFDSTNEIIYDGERELIMGRVGHILENTEVLGNPRVMKVRVVNQVRELLDWRI